MTTASLIHNFWQSWVVSADADTSDGCTSYEQPYNDGGWMSVTVVQMVQLDFPVPFGSS